MLGLLHRVGKYDIRIGRLGPLGRPFTAERIFPFAYPPADASSAFILFYRDPIQRHFLICFFVAPPPVSLSRDLPTFQRCGSRVDCCQMFRLSDLSPAHFLSLLPNKAKVRFDTLLFDAIFVDDVLSIQYSLLLL